MPLLYIDLLGMKSRYRATGVNGARAGHRQLVSVVRAGLQALPDGALVSGGIQSDAVALQFLHAFEAIVVGRAILLNAFTRSNRARRIWLRGAVMKHGGPKSRLDSIHAIDGCPDGIVDRQFREVLLNAVHVEQSGFRGQRLLVEGGLLDDRLAVSTELVFSKGRAFSPVRRLTYSGYPAPVCDGFADVLWMVPAQLSAWENRKLRMLDLLRWSSKGGEEEMAQAAATHLVFAEADAMLNSVAPP